MLLGAALSGCAESEIEDFANATRSQAERIAQSAGITTNVDDLRDMDDEPAVQRPRPEEKAESEPKEAPPLTEMMDPNQPFAPMVEPEPSK